MHMTPGRTFGVREQALLWGLVLGSWALALTIPALGHGGALSHDAILDGAALPPLSTLALFLVAWQVMTAAMMLPSSLPLVSLFARASQGQARPTLTLAIFLLAYFAVWTLFALLALLGDAGVHLLSARWAWLDAHPWVIAGSMLLVAGGFQFSPLKERCLDVCRTPLNFLLRHYQRGMGAAWELGIRHGLFCLGCCWALMLTMFATGVGSIAWMAGLTGVMVVEKAIPWGRRLAPIVGVLLLAWGALLLIQPPWIPGILQAP